MLCYFCCEKERPTYFSHFCDDCNSLRRLMLSYSPSKCTEILKRTCLRDDKQIGFKINQEIKKIVIKEIETKNIEKVGDESHVTPKTRSKSSVKN